MARSLTVSAGAICAQLRDAVAAAGWTATAEAAGMDRANLHRAFRGAGCERVHFTTIVAVADALGLEITIAPKGQR